MCDEGKGSIGELAFYYNNIGLTWYHQSSLEVHDPDAIKNSIRAYNKAIKKNPTEAVYFFNRGNVYLNLKDFAKAHEDFDTAIKLKNDNPTDLNYKENPKFFHAKGLAYQA